MAADVYIQEAAHRLREAVTTMRDDIHTIQTEAYRTETQLHGDIARAENEIMELKVESRATSIDLTHRAGLEARIRQLDNEVRQKKAEISKQSTDAAHIVQAKNNVVSRVEALIGQVEAIAASAR